MKGENFKRFLMCFVSALIGAGAVMLCINFYPDLFSKVVTETIETKNVSITDNGIAEAVDKIYDAVVVVKTYKNKELYSTGTGFVYEINGKTAHILTNNHVIESGDDVYVQFTDGNSVKVEIVGNDKYADIAVLKMEANDSVKVASLGSSESLRIGDTVFAVGAPLDASTYSGTVTRGIISGKNRLVSVSLTNSNSTDWVMSVLQTDAAINSGNSGGPLANANGEVIGITSLKLVNSGVEGMGFAIPIETAMEYAKKIVNGEEIQRPYLGVSMYNLSDAKYRVPGLNKIPISQGVYVQNVESGSPSDAAGIKAGDIITKINNEEVPTYAYLRYLLYQHDVGDEITVTIYRDGKEENKTIKLTVASKD